MRFPVLLILLWMGGVVSVQAAEERGAVRMIQPRVLKASPVRMQPAQFKPLTAVKINRAVITRLPHIKPVVVPKPVKPQGPDPLAAMDLSDVIEDPDLLRDLSEASGWDGHLIFQDKAAGHVFYYLPREILLLHDPKGYQLNVQYNYQDEKDKPSVLISADLGAPFRNGDVGLLKAVLREALDLKQSDPLELKSLKGLGAEVDLQSLSTGFSLPPERIHIVPPAHLKQPLRLTLSLTQDEAEEVLAQISREGLTGSLKVPVGDQIVPIPIRIQYSHFTGERVAGFDDWAQGRPLKKLGNLTSFPMHVEAINAYRQKGNRLERVSKNLKKATPVPPKAKRPFSLPAAEKLLGKGILVAWLGTSLDSDCTKCLQSIDREVRKGVALAPANPVIFEAIPEVFSEFDLYKILIKVRSPYFIAGSSTVKEQEIVLTEEENLNNDLSLYLPSDKGADHLLYRYQMQAVLASGEMMAEQKWHDARSLRQFIGASQLEGILSTQEALEEQ